MSDRVRVHSFKLGGEPTPFIARGSALQQVAVAMQPGSLEALLACPEKEALVSGPRGTGKTVGVLADFAQEIGAGYGAAWKGIMFRRSMTGFAELKSLAEQYIMRVFPDCSYNQNNSHYRFATGESLKLSYFDEAIDYAIYQGASYTWLGWEELTQWETDQCLRMMLSTLRSTIVPSHLLRTRGTTNPDGNGHNWVKNRYKASDYYALGERIIGPRIEADNVGPCRRLIYSTLRENQLLLNVQPDYVQNVKVSATDEGKTQSWVNGSWQILSGDMFSDIWNNAKPYATLPIFSADEIPGSWRIDRSIDFGDSAPFSILWFAESDGSPITHEGRTYNFIRGDLICFMEWFGEGREPGKGLRLPAPMIRDGIIEREIEAGLRRQDPLSGKWHSRVYAGPADSQIWNLKPGAGGDEPVGSIADDFAEPTTINGHRFRGVAWEQANKSPGTRVHGWQAIRSRLNATIPDKNGIREKAGLFVCEGVRSFFDYVLVLPRDLKGNREDIVQTGSINDHTADCLRYRMLHSTRPAFSTRRRTT